VYDTIVLDCPPTASTLRFIGMASGLKWYANNRLPRERALAKVLRPLARIVDKEAFFLPDDAFFGAFAQITARLESIEGLLLDPDVTSLRLVANPERMVLRETQRAFMYFSIYGVAVDQVVFNRVFSRDEPYFQGFAAAQKTLIETMADAFEGVPVATVPFLAFEVVGVEALDKFATILFGDTDPGAVLHRRTPVVFKQEKDEFQLEVAVPFVEKQDIEVSRQADAVTIRVGTFKRRIGLPDGVARYAHNDAKMVDQKLVVRFW
jgi:arsenite-transporting ATPase